MAIDLFAAVLEAAGLPDPVEEFRVGAGFGQQLTSRCPCQRQVLDIENYTALQWITMSKQTAEPRYLNYPAAAKYIGVSVGTLRRMVERGEAKAYPIGERLVRFDRAELDALVRGDRKEEQKEIAP